MFRCSRISRHFNSHVLYFLLWMSVFLCLLCSPLKFPSFFLTIERDPRRKQVLEEPRPNISFVLCNACVTSPALVVLKDADIIAGKHLLVVV